MLILANARCSICLHGLMCYRTEDIHISIHCSSIISFHQSCRDYNVLPHSFTALDVFLGWFYSPVNMIAQSQSGTGKTAAFVLTMLSRVDTNQPYPQVNTIKSSILYYSKHLYNAQINSELFKWVGWEKKCRLLKFKKNSELRSWLKQLLPYSFNYCFIVCYSFSASVLLLHTS